jgi:hypothetical protein
LYENSHFQIKIFQDASSLIISHDVWSKILKFRIANFKKFVLENPEELEGATSQGNFLE